VEVEGAAAGLDGDGKNLRCCRRWCRDWAEGDVVPDDEGQAASLGVVWAIPSKDGKAGCCSRSAPCRPLGLLDCCDADVVAAHVVDNVVQ